MTIQKSLIMSHHQVVYLLLLVIRVTCQSQPETTSPNGTPLRQNQASTVIIGMLLSTLLFSLLACFICYKFSSSSSHGTNSDIEEGGREGGVRTRRTSRGLETDVVKSFPSFLYSQVKGLKIGKGGVECAICLNEFEDDEMLRLMPPCSHAFHADCIDVWLSSRATCPVCRAKLGSDQNLLYPTIQANQDMDLEMERARRSVLESPDVRLLDGLVENNNNMTTRPPRSRSTRSPNWRITDLMFPRSHTTGHSLVPPGENLDRFTLQLPEEVKRQLSHKSLPQARSSRQGYRSGSVGSEPNERRSNRKTVSLSFSLSFQMESIQSSKGKEKEVGEGSFDRLKPEA